MTKNQLEALNIVKKSLDNLNTKLKDVESQMILATALIQINYVLKDREDLEIKDSPSSYGVGL